MVLRVGQVQIRWQDCSPRNEEGSVLRELAASSRTENAIEVQARLRIGVINIVRGEQTMPLRSYVGKFQLHVPR